MDDVVTMPDFESDMPDFHSVGDMGDPAASTSHVESVTSSTLLSDKRARLRAQLESFSLADQQRLRSALRQVWTNEEVQAARLAYRLAGQKYQQALFDALVVEDQNLQPYLEKLIRAGMHVPFGRAVEPYVRAARLFDVPERDFEAYKDVISDAFRRASQSADVRVIQMQLKHTTPDHRNELNSQLRDAMRDALLRELPEIHNWIAEQGDLSA